MLHTVLEVISISALNKISSGLSWCNVLCLASVPEICKQQPDIYNVSSAPAVSVLMQRFRLFLAQCVPYSTVYWVLALLPIAYMIHSSIICSMQCAAGLWWPFYLFTGSWSLKQGFQTAWNRPSGELGTGLPDILEQGFRTSWNRASVYLGTWLPNILEHNFRTSWNMASKDLETGL